MVEFLDSQWSRRNVAAEFVENADRYIVERRRMLNIVSSAYHHHVHPRVSGRNARVLDLGSGDGALTHELLRANGMIEATLVDASAEMLESARQRLRSYSHVEFLRYSFQELLRDRRTLPTFDMVVSALAIHHLDLSEKKALFAYVFDHLSEGGSFVNVDVVLARDPSVEEWYLVLWSEWIREHAGPGGRDFGNIPQQYKTNPDNVPDPLDEQLGALGAAGFSAVDCYYKYGIFAIYGGRK